MKEATVAGKLVALNFYNERWVGLSLPTSHVRVRAVRQGIKRAHVESGSGQRLRRPLTWRMLAAMEGCSQEWGMGVRVTWIGLALTYLLLRSSELFAEESGVFHELYCLRRGDVAFFSRAGGSWEEVRERKRRTRWKSGSKARKGTKEEKERC